MPLTSLMERGLADDELACPSFCRSVNYSPKHARKPSSLLTLRNINMKRLLLNLAPRLLLALAIPALPPSPPLLASLTLQSPFHSALLAARAAVPGASDSDSPDSGLSTDSASVSSIERAVLADAQTPHKVTETASAANPRLPSHDHPPAEAKWAPEESRAPEELQEQSMLNAYPQGPANVLNLLLYLYSDPRLSELPVDINAYDLVINVAAECENLASAFHKSAGRYVYVPWLHTSSILHDLPWLTQIMSDYDRDHKKILVHCQCGVLRLACVIVAFFMVKFSLSVNDAYELLKTGTANTAEPPNALVAAAGHHVQACDRICPNMNLIFELMDFGETLAPSDR